MIVLREQIKGGTNTQNVFWDPGTRFIAQYTQSYHYSLLTVDLFLFAKEIYKKVCLNSKYDKMNSLLFQNVVVLVKT